MTTFHFPLPVIEIATRLDTAGFEAWAVGGAVRDTLWGIEPHDWDVATDARPADIARVFGADFRPGFGEGHGVCLVVVGGMNVEVATFRRDVACDGRRADVEFSADISADIIRRDFTVNAIAVEILTGVIVAPVGALDDIETRTIRFVGSAEERLEEDNLRALRFIRFSFRAGCSPDISDAQTVREFIRSRFPGLLSAERIWAEIVRIAETGFDGLWAVVNTGLFQSIFPAFNPVMMNIPNATPIVQIASMFVGQSWAAREFCDFMRVSNEERDIIEGVARWNVLPPVTNRAGRASVIRSHSRHIGAICSIFNVDPNEAREIIERTIPINGSDVVAFGWSGQDVGRILAELVRINDTMGGWMSRETAMRIVEEWA